MRNTTEVTQQLQLFFHEMLLGLLTTEEAGVLAQEFVKAGGKPNIEKVMNENIHVFANVGQRLMSPMGKMRLAELIVQDSPAIKKLLAEMDEEAEKAMKDIDERINKMNWMLERSKKLDPVARLSIALDVGKALEMLFQLRCETQAFQSKSRQELLATSASMRENLAKVLGDMSKLDPKSLN